MNAIATGIIIDDEFRDLIPPLTPDERDGLEADILREGCLDAIKTWRTEDGDIVLDGHNRCAPDAFLMARTIEGREITRSMKDTLLAMSCS